MHLHTHHVVTLAFMDIPRWSDGTAGHMDGEAARWKISEKEEQIIVTESRKIIKEMKIRHKLPSSKLY